MKMATFRLRYFSRTMKCQFITSSGIRESTEPAIFNPDVAKQNNEFVGAFSWLAFFLTRVAVKQLES